MAMLAALECVDVVTSFSEDTPLNIIREVEPDILVKGGDYSIDEIVGADTVKRRGGRVERITFIDGISTSEIIDRVKADRGVTFAPSI